MTNKSARLTSPASGGIRRVLARVHVLVHHRHLTLQTLVPGTRHVALRSLEIV